MSFPCTYSSGGGEALYLKDGYDFQIHEDLRIDAIENLWVDTGDLIVGIIYNPPNWLLGEFLDNMENVLHSIYLSKKKCLILGDINMKTLLKNSKCMKYLNLINSEGFSPLIFEATRITENSISCIDHIHSNFISFSTSGSIAYKVADLCSRFYMRTLNTNLFLTQLNIEVSENFKDKPF